MITIRPASERGNARLSWLNSYHTFSFGEYFDPEHMGVSNLRVINDDTVAPGGGFATHGHRDMEIVSYVLSGALEHKDSMGNGSVIRPGDVQRMSAGTGVRHSEYNPSDQEPVHFLQIWLEPNQKGVEPGYDQKHFSNDERRNRLTLLVSPDGRDGSISAHQDGLFYGTLLETGMSVGHELDDGRVAWIHVAKGAIRLNGQLLEEGDGASISGEESLHLEAETEAEVLLFDLPGQ
jgi:redox-sensitive bicupin YhaK (pirin superfamily)